MLKVEVPAKIGAKVVDEKLKHVGTVFDVFGPVSEPYITVKPSIQDPAGLVNHMLYVVPSAENHRESRRRGSNGGR